MGRRVAKVNDLTRAIDPVPTAPSKPVPPEPNEMQENDRLVLRSLARAKDWAPEIDFATHAGVDRVGTQAAALRLRNYGLAVRSEDYWKLSDDGALYVDHHRRVIMHVDEYED